MLGAWNLEFIYPHGGVQDPALLEHKNLLTVPIIVEIFVTTIRDDNLVLDL